MKKALSLTLAFCCLLVALPASADTLTMGFFMGLPTDEAWVAFQQAHPETEVAHAGGTPYTSTTALFERLLSGQMKEDIFVVDTAKVDVASVFQKGYALDLAAHPDVDAAIHRMHPPIAAQVYRDGKIYGLPTQIWFDYRQVNHASWEKYGYTTEDIPTTMTELLDFLEAWCHRVQAEGLNNVYLYGWYDETFQPYTYTAWLVNLAIDSHVSQSSFAGQPLTFHDPTLQQILARCLQVGQLIHETEPHPSTIFEGMAFDLMFSDGFRGMWPDQEEYLYFTRISADQPKLITCDLTIASVRAGSEMEEKAAAFLGGYAKNPKSVLDYNTAFLYQDAAPVPDPNYEMQVQMFQQRIDAIERAIAKGDTETEEGKPLEEELEREKDRLAQLNPYMLTQEQLARYQRHADGLYFPKPSVFSDVAEGRDALSDLVDQYAASVISLDQLLARLDQMAQMMELEGQ